MSSDCLFCKIIKGDIPGTIVYRDEQVTAFRDINPAAPTHVLIVPNKHIESVNMLIVDDEPLIGHPPASDRRGTIETPNGIRSCLR